VGFLAGAVTDDVHPDALFGNAFQPLVTLGVGLILFEAGLRLRLHELTGGAHRVVMRLIVIGTLVLGAILVVSGPTVVMPLLAYVRPTDRVRTVLKWEGVIIDPVGAVLGVLAFHAVKAGAGGGKPFHPGEFALSLGVGAAAGALGAAVLWWLLRRVQREAPAQAVAAALLTLAAALVAADAIRDDSGFVAVTVMGVVMANQEEVDVY